MTPRKSLADRFWAKVDKGAELAPGGCWLWIGSTERHGYGQISVGAKHLARAHRISYELNIGAIPSGMVVCHRCDLPVCVNPAHLFIGTLSDNSRDMISKGRGIAQFKKKTHCSRGHEFNSTNTYWLHNLPRCRICRNLRDRASYSQRRAS